MNINLKQGDCLEVMKELPDNSVDAVITDPPYFLSNKNTINTKDVLNRKEIKTKGFMGNSWDGGKFEVVEKNEVPKELL